MRAIFSREGISQFLDDVLKLGTLGIPDEQVNDAVNRAQMKTLPFVYASVGTFFIVYAILQAGFLNEPGREIMVTVALLSAALMFMIHQFIVRGAFSPSRAEPLAAILAVVILISIQLRFYLTQDPKQAANIALFAFAMGILFLATKWHILMLIFAFIALGHTIWLYPEYPDWNYYIVVCLAASGTGMVAHIGRVRAFRRTEVLRIVEQRQREELHRRNIQMRTSMVVGRQVTSILDLETLLSRIVELVWEQYRIYYVGVFLPAENSRRMRVGAEAGRAVANGPLRLEAGLTGQVGWVLANGEVLYLPDIRKDVRYIASEKAPEAKSELLLPLKMGERVLGVLDLQSERPSRFSHDEIPVFQLLADQIAIALENAQLYAEIKNFNIQLEAKVDERTKALQEAYAQLEKLDKTKTDFITIASHELLTPLTIINFNSQMFLEDETIRANSYYSKWAEGIHKGTARMQDVVNSMLDVAKIDSQSLEMYPSPTDIRFLIQQVAKKFNAAFAEREITFTLAPMPGLPEIEADVEGLQKLFHHLIANAIKYTPNGGRVEIYGRKTTLLRHNEEVEAVEIVVADTGIGIAPEVQDLIFEKFYQTGEVMLHSSGQTSFKGGGSGLGLAIARGIVLTHNGRIWVESTSHDEDELPGSQFFVVLPVRQPQ